MLRSRRSDSLRFEAAHSSIFPAIYFTRAAMAGMELLSFRKPCSEHPPPIPDSIFARHVAPSRLSDRDVALTVNRLCGSGFPFQVIVSGAQLLGTAACWSAAARPLAQAPHVARHTPLGTKSGRVALDRVEGLTDTVGCSMGEMAEIVTVYGVEGQC